MHIFETMYYIFVQTFAWGCPNDAALGLGKTLHNHVEARPRAPDELASVEVIQAATGQSHTLWLDDSGRVWASGRNREGQCGATVSTRTMERPRVIAGLSAMYVSYIAAGALSSACVVDGKLFEVRESYTLDQCHIGVVVSRNVFYTQWGFCCTSLKKLDDQELGHGHEQDQGEVSYEDAMESMVQLTGLVS
jgi:hypothetical protein